MLGRTLSHYQILGKLGEGGMGVVYLAEDMRLRRRVALKVLPSQMAHDPRPLRRFELEARAVAALNHPNIVTLYAIEEADGERFLAMELVEGQTLDRVLPANGLEPGQLLKLAVPMADALAAAHAKGITHRDFKPGNIMVTAEERVKILDFGLAKLFDRDSTQLQSLPKESLTQDGRLVGTLAYMAPELLQGKEPNPRSDVFALGIVLYEMATGVSPFPGSNPADLISAVLRDQPAEIRRLKPTVPNVVSDVIDRCLKKAPEERYQNAAEVRDALQTVLNQLTTQEVLGRRGFGSFPRLTRRNLVGVGGVALALLATTLGWWGWQRRVTAQATSTEGVSRGLPSVKESAAVVVLPLSNRSGEPDYFVDGMTDDLISALAKLKGIRVISRQSAMYYKGSRQLLPEIARELGVGFVVEGWVERAGDRVKLKTSVVQAEPESLLWSDTLEGREEQTAELYNRFARAVSEALGVSVSATEHERLAAAREVDPEVYKTFLEGRFYANRFSLEDHQKAVALFEKAISKDPLYAPAWAAMAYSLNWLAAFDSEPERFRPRARQAAERALQVDASLADGYAALGEMALDRWDWAEAERQLRLAVDLDPSSATARRKFWHLLVFQRRLPEAREQIERAVQTDPVSAPVRTSLGVQFLIERKYNEALRELSRALELDPSYSAAHMASWLVYHSLEQEPERGQELAAYLAGWGYPELRKEFERQSAEFGYRQALQKVALELEQLEKQGSAPVGVAAGLLSLAGEEEKALESLQRGFDGQAWELGWLAVMPDYEPLHDQPKYLELVKKLGLPAPERQER